MSQFNQRDKIQQCPKRQNHVLQVQWVVGAWKQIKKEVVKKSHEFCRIKKSDPDKIHFMGKGQPTEEARLLLGESNSSIKIVPRPTLEDNMQEETEIYNVQNAEDLTDKILDEGAVEVIMI